ncbi:MAG TPA: amidohydrolase family protein [Lysobacter sp.]|nr:amidohydrolase family protein [Lysobacter sp.]
MKRTLALFPTALSLAMLLASPAFAAETLRYVALVDGGKQAGHQIVTTGDDGVTRVDYIFKDNGRGPELKEEFRLGPDGTFTSYHVKGSTTFGAPVDESFKREGDKATWKSTSDQGEQTISGTGFYTPLAGSPADISVALTALAKRADGKLPLIPGGTLSMRKIAEVDVARGDEKRKVQLLAITGVGLVPQFVWATTDAEPRLFAFIFPGWMQLVEEGWDASAADLETRQKQAEADALVDLQKRVSHSLKGTTLIRNARVFDSQNAVLGPASDVLVRNGRIVSIANTGGKAAMADNVIDANGRVLLPGLFDMHGHLGRWDGGLNLATGVTTVRDMGNDNATLQQLIAEEQAGTLLATHIVPAGFIEGESQMSARNGFVIKNLDEAKKAVDWYAAHGYPQIKVYNSFPKDILRDTAAYAHSKGMRVSGHVPAFMRAQDVVDDGYDEIQHINQVLLNFLVDDKTDTRTLQRFYLPAEKVADLDFDSQPVQDFIAMLAKKQIVIDPTVSTFEFVRQRAGDLPQSYAPIADHMPPDIQRGLRSAEMKIPDDATAARYNKSYEKMIEFVGRMYKAGVPIVAGTDGIPGFTIQSELEWYVRAGLTPAQVLQIATWNGAKYARVLDDRGSITPGKRSDLVLIDGDPTKNISDIRNVTLVLKGDTAYYPSEIFDALGIKPFAQPVKAAAGH